MYKKYRLFIVIILMSVIITCFSDYSSVQASNNYVVVNGYAVTSYTEDINSLASFSSLSDGEVDVEKSVEYNDDGTFNISLMARGKEYVTNLTDETEYNIVFVLDNSGSMYNTSSRIQESTAAINEIIRELSDYSNVNVSVVAYSSVNSITEALGQSASTVLLELGHYTSSSDSDTFIEYVDGYDSSIHQYGGQEYYEQRYVMSTTSQNGSTYGKKQYAGNTYIQAGIISAYEVLSSATNKDTAKPIIILMSDGEATNYAIASDGDMYTDYDWTVTSIEDLENDYYTVTVGSTEFTTNSIMPYVTLRSAVYIKSLLAEQYTKDVIFYTFGYDIASDYYYAQATLNPIKSNIDALRDYMESGYEQYGMYSLVYNSGLSIDSLMYTDAYYSNASGSSAAQIYKQMLFEDSESEYSAVKTNEYLQITDTIGDGMEIDTDNGSVSMVLTMDGTGKLITLTSSDFDVYTYYDENVNVKYTKSTNTVEFNAISDLFYNQDVDLEFTVKLKDTSVGNISGIVYYTNSSASYSFSTSAYNPTYGGETVTGKLTATGSIVLTKVKGNVITKYVDTDGNEIETQETSSGYIFDSYETFAKSIYGYTLKTTPDNATGVYTVEDTIVTYVYERIPASITVNHIDNTTGEILVTELINGYVGDVKTTSAKDINGYIIYQTPSVEEYELTTTTKTVNYYYKKQANVIVNYIDENTGEKITDSTVTTYTEGDSYYTTKTDFDGYTYIRVEGTTSGTIERDDIEVTYYYRQISGGLGVKYIVQTTGEVLKELDYSGNVGDTVQLDEITFSNYFLISRPEEEEVTLTADYQEYIFYYKKVVKLNIVGIDQLTGETLYTSSMTGVEDEEYETEAEDLSNYVLVVVPDNSNGIYQAENEDVIYEYKQYAGDLTVKYVDSNTGETLESYIVSGYVGDKYETEQKEFENYNFVKVTGNVSGTLTASEQEVIYYYEKKTGTVIVKYVDTDDNIILKESMEGEVGEEYIVVEATIENYDIIERPDETTGEYIDGEIELVYVVQRQEGTITINFIDTEGNTLYPTIYNDGYVGDELYMEAPTIDGYTAIENATVTVTFINGELVIDVVYEANSTEIVDTSDLNIVLLLVIALISIYGIKRKAHQL